MIDWRDAAACRGLPIEFFYIEEDADPGSQLPENPTVKRMCAGCPAREECLEHAIKHEDYGFWAGTTAKERKRIRKERGIWLDRPELAA